MTKSWYVDIITLKWIYFPLITVASAYLWKIIAAYVFVRHCLFSQPTTLGAWGVLCFSLPPRALGSKVKVVRGGEITTPIQDMRRELRFRSKLAAIPSWSRGSGAGPGRGRMKAGENDCPWANHWTALSPSSEDFIGSVAFNHCFEESCGFTEPSRDPRAGPSG